MAVALTTTSCSLQDYAYLGAGVENTDTTDDETRDETGETEAPDASDTNITTDTTETDLDASSPFEAGDSDEDAGDATGVVDTTDTTLDADVTDTVDTTEPPDNTTEEDAGPQPPLVVPGNLIPNSSFENPLTGWQSFGNAIAVISDERAHTGVRSMRSTNRTQNWEGPALDILQLVESGVSYRFKARVQSGSGQQSINFSMKEWCVVEPEPDAGPPVVGMEPGVTYHNLGSAGFVTETEWREVTGDVVIPECELRSLEIYFEGPAEYVDFYVDDVSMVPI